MRAGTHIRHEAGSFKNESTAFLRIQTSSRPVSFTEHLLRVRLVAAGGESETWKKEGEGWEPGEKGPALDVLGVAKSGHRQNRSHGALAWRTRRLSTQAAPEFFAVLTLLPSTDFCPTFFGVST
ncbi:hypothetical protein KM043_002875 [Ampulex compressa]|nr:hypothetical protein KM043_002875 [Ampulex compressa]